MEDSTFLLFIGFGVLWAILGAAGWMALLKADGQEIRLGKWGLVVAVPILIPIVAAFIFVAVYH
jgi:uncharacterized membrane protein YidH (DUF202 family)